MKPEQKEKFFLSLTAISEIYQKTLSEGALSLWWDVLKKYDYETVSEALSKYLTNPDQGHFMPKPASIIRMIEGGGSTNAMTAWYRVMDGLMSTGTYETVSFGDPATHYAIEAMGGWSDFGLWEMRENPFKQKEFERLYLAHKENPERAGDEIKTLPGKHDIGNRNIGHKQGGVIYLGDKVVAQKEMEELCQKKN